MIYYVSTRGEKRKFSFSEAILKGIASDGGLFVPERLPVFSLEQLAALRGSSYQEVAAFLFSLFEVGIPKSVVRNLIDEAYSSQFDTSEIAPVKKLKHRQYMLELWHGPTLAFKDMALQLMPLFFAEAVRLDNEMRINCGIPPLSYLILVATSGDTGKAALEGYTDKDAVSIAVFYPHKHVSALQELQMTTQAGTNVAVFALEGDFDAAQRSVKETFRDRSFAKTFAEKNVVLSSANSINWGRLLPQIVYYISGYLDLVQKKAVDLGKVIDVCVPTGNFGNLLAAVYAKRMGLPIRKLLCASNENNVLTTFLRSGIYDLRNLSLVSTPAPSMDILVASNIERLLYLLTNDAVKVSDWMQDLAAKKYFMVDDETKLQLADLFVSDFVSNEACLQNIKRVFEETRYICDPHTSIAQLVAERSMKGVSESVPMLVVSTAHFSKFAPAVYAALFGRESDGRDDFVLLSEICRETTASLPRQIIELRQKPVRFSEVLPSVVALIEKRLLSLV